MMKPFNDVPDESDETLRRVQAALKPLPPPDHLAVARVLSAVHGRAPQPTPRWREFLDWTRVPSLSVAGATGLVAVALVAGYLADGRLRRADNPGADNSVTLSTNPSGGNGVESGNVATGANVSPTVPVVAANAVIDAERAQPVQFVLDLPNAHTVSVVGDFNDWTVDQAPMQFANGAWSITLPVKPGRHEYAFVVDGKRWMADPRAPKARDNEFGKPGSVIVVSTP